MHTFRPCISLGLTEQTTASRRLRENEVLLARTRLQTEILFEKESGLESSARVGTG